MLAYRIALQADDNGTVLVDFPDFPEAHTFGDDESDAIRHAADALETVIEAYMKDRRPIPLPSKGSGRTVALSALMAAKVELYMAMVSRGVRKAELARRLHWKPPQVDRLLSLRHGTQFRQLEAAAFALDSQLVISLVPQPVMIERGAALRNEVTLPRSGAGYSQAKRRVAKKR